jgi:hypothetical protein
MEQFLFPEWLELNFEKLTNGYLPFSFSLFSDLLCHWFKAFLTTVGIGRPMYDAFSTRLMPSFDR